ncbi:MAG: S8 family peptidase [Bacteroidetes bacterium]|nr:S8 family peptidase [Bacteroidota bacterium]
MQKTFTLFLLCFSFFSGEAQFTKYIVRFKDKGTNPYSINNPSQYLSQRALDRRTRYHIAIDSLDLPVTPRYIDSIRLAGSVSILNVSKWLNQVSIQTTDPAALNKINSFPFVLSTNPVAARVSAAGAINKRYDIAPDAAISNQSIQRTTAGFYNYGQSEAQVKIHNGDFLHNHGFRGEGMQMAILDAGFYHYLSLPTFDSVRNNNQVLGTWDFVANEASVDEDYYHGMQCFSTIAANMPGVFVGTSPKASFYLYRTEDVNSEYPIEEHNWAAGIERADSLGVDISSTSLGYSTFDNASLNYTYASMNGNTTISARAADIAAAKGILVVAAAGNEGNSAWHFITTPSDADSSLCVGAVNVNGVVGGFSSYGPSSDGQIKPSVAAVGWNAVVASPSNGQPSFNSGTSFACPNMAGITTCLWQAFPEVNNMSVIAALEASANRWENPDDRTGYGIPDVKKAFVILQKQLYTRQSSIVNCTMDIQFNVKTDATMNIEVERKSATDASFTLLPGNLSSSENYGMHAFHFIDDLGNLSMGTYQYRLKVNIDTDTSYYLDTINVNYDQTCALPAENSVKIGPNPFTDHINVMIARTTDSKIEVVLRNSIGQKVYKSNFQQPAGMQTLVIPMQSFSRGIYFLTVYANGKKEVTKKMVK